MPGSQPKEGIRYETLVAAALSGEHIQAEGTSIDLTACTFNVSPQSYNAAITGAGYDVNVDLSAAAGNTTFLVECKSSLTPNEVLRPQSEQLLDAMLEFLALQNFAELSRWNLHYVLVVNFPIGNEVRGLFKDLEKNQLRNFRSNIGRYGSKRHGKRFRPRLASSRRLSRTMSSMSLIMLTDQYLKEKLKTDASFRQRCEKFSSQLRIPKPGHTLERGAVAVPGCAYVTFLCRSQSHAECQEIAEDKIVCHVGSSKRLAKKLYRYYESLSGSAVKLVKSREIGFSASDVRTDSWVSPKDAAAALTFSINRILEQEKCADMTTMVVPGTFDIVVADRKKVAQVVRSSYDGQSGKYNLNQVSELSGLGQLVKVELAKHALQLEYKIVTSEEDYLAEDESTLDALFSLDP